MTFKGVDSEQMIAMETDKYFFLAIPYSMYPINKETLEYKNPIYPEMNFKIRENERDNYQGFQSELH